MPTVNEVFGTGIIDGNDYVGIEVEMENVTSLPAELPFWSMTDDGSLQNHGKEFVSKPLRLNKVAVALERLQTEIDSRNYVASFRCGVHVHWNVGHWDQEQLWRFYLIYLAFENLIYRYVTDVRSQSVFCIPVQSTDFPVNLVRDKGSRSAPNFDHFIRRTTKYSGLNLLPLTQHGTIEFRHLGGTSNMAEVREWVDIITRLVKLSEEITIQQLTAINTTSEYTQWIDRVFPNNSLEGSEEYLSRLLRIGVRYVKQAI